MTGRLALLAAGGTGGHLFPAQALAAALIARGWRVHLATDHRAEGYGGDFPAEAMHIIPSATVTRSIPGMTRALWRMGRGLMQSWRLVRTIRPAVAVGFGGYPTLPPMLAAARAHVPTIIHDQNAVLGRANRFLARRVDYLATSVAGVTGAAGLAAHIVETGNPVRPAVAEAAATPYPQRAADAPFNLLVFGGSQGASFLSDLVPAAVATLDAGLRSRLAIVQQCRKDDLDKVRERYQGLGVTAELLPFFTDLPRRMAASHAVVSRSGASTCAELAAIGRPAVMIPLPGAIDQDQTANARLIAQAGGGWMVEQAELTPERLGAMLTDFIAAPEALAEAAGKARTLGRLDAAERLADLVERAAEAGALVNPETHA